VKAWSLNATDSNTVMTGYRHYNRDVSGLRISQRYTAIQL
jgi:hypothetical protein